MRITKNCVIDFFGCIWDAQWEFDCPVVIYSPIKQYSPNGHSIPCSALSLIDDIASDLSAGLEVSELWHDSDLKEFSWRRWSEHGFKYRKGAFHVWARYEFKWNGEYFDATLVFAKEKAPGLKTWKRIKEATL